ncbi:MAG: hypothetical protein HY675_09730 [Chloroflexi bacterium]|nr:hypothetical protein [Chloroflexota bacterium]
MMIARSNQYAGEPRRRSVVGGLTRTPLAVAQAVAIPEDEKVFAGQHDCLRPYVYLAAGLSFVAAQIHGWAMLEHLSEQPAEGLFFLAVAFAQGAYAAALLDRPRSVPLLIAGLVATIGLMLLLVAAHTVGLPLVGLEQHSHHNTKAFDPLALAALVVEAGLILALVALLRAQRIAGCGGLSRAP